VSEREKPCANEESGVLTSFEKREIPFEPHMLRISWSSEFLELAGSSPDFPYPDEPGTAEPAPDLE
jgi:hypothetical protein